MLALKLLTKQRRRAGWISTAGLIAATLLLAEADHGIGQLPGNVGPPLCFLPSMLGPCLLTALQQLCLALVFFAVWAGAISGHSAPSPLHALLALLGPIPLLIALTCLAKLRQGHELQQTTLRDKLERSLQASALAHELGQPLSQLLLQTRLALYRLEQQHGLPAGTLEPLEHLQQSGQQIQELIAAITGLLNNQPLAREAVDLAAITRRCLRELEPLRRNQRMALQSTGLDETALVLGDAKQLEIAISNLLRNAQESLRTQAPNHRHLSVVISRRQGELVLCIADSGAGLPSSEQQDLLMNSDKPSGMGLGLLTAQNVARRHGGALRLGASVALGGAELCLSLPAAR